VPDHGEALGQESDLIEGHAASVAGRRLALEADLVASSQTPRHTTETTMGSPVGENSKHSLPQRRSSSQMSMDSAFTAAPASAELPPGSMKKSVCGCADTVTAPTA
jgi:hypothetical protein